MAFTYPAVDDGGLGEECVTINVFEAAADGELEVAFNGVTVTKCEDSGLEGSDTIECDAISVGMCTVCAVTGISNAESLDVSEATV